MNKILKNTLFISLSFLLLLGILIFGILWSYSNNIPDYRFLKNYKPPVSSKVYSGDGELVADFSKEKRIFIPFNSIPKNVINSFLSAEDKNFFSHPGVDAKGVLRALINNISNIILSKRLEGASTITQQVAKNFLLTNEVSINRKIKEAILAFRIERALSKQRILELYLNQIYLGSGAYGVAAASLEYFDKSIQELDYGEAALLAALPKAPSRYNPYRDIDLAKFRRDLVLKNLFENKYIDISKYEELEAIVTNKKYSLVFHLAAQTQVTDALKYPISTLKSNIEGTWNLLEICRVNNLPIVSASSDKAYGESSNLPYLETHPLNGKYPYEVSKSASDLISTMYKKTYDVDVVTLRCGNIYGGGDLNWDRLIPGTIQCFLMDKTPILRTKGDFIREWVYVKDVANAYIKTAISLLERKNNFTAYNFSSGESKTVMEIYEKISKAVVGKIIKPKIDDLGIVLAIFFVSSLSSLIDPNSVKEICLAALVGSFPFIIIVKASLIAKVAITTNTKLIPSDKFILLNVNRVISDKLS